jgi:thymidine kinase
MESSFNINDKKIKSVEILQIIKEHKDRPNKDLKLAMDFIQEDFEMTKDNLLKLSKHLDKLENTYNLLLKEYTDRVNLK